MQERQEIPDRAWDGTLLRQGTESRPVDVQPFHRRRVDVCVVGVVIFAAGRSQDVLIIAV